MSGNIFNRLCVATLLLLFGGAVAGAQSYGSYTPYSMFGLGDLMEGGSAYNRTMGGAGIAVRSNRFINALNPAAVTARDSLAFMSDFSMYQDNKYFAQGGRKSVGNTLSLSDLIITFPIYHHSAMMVGIAPFSSTGYGYGDYYTDPALIAQTGPVAYTANGHGSIYQGFAAAGVTFWKRLSLGAQATLLFGQNERTFTETFTDSSFNGVQNGIDLDMRAFTWKFGLQYEQPLGANSSLTLGATYRLGTDLRGEIENYKYSSGSAAVVDTISHSAGSISGVKIADEIGVGLSFRSGNRFLLTADYTRADWTKSGLDVTKGFAGNLIPGKGSSIFTNTVAESYRVGVEIVPNPNDVRYYFNTCSYRAGVYHKKEYFALDGNRISSTGITLGITLPVFRRNNGITLGMEIGQRGTLKDNLIRERYVNFSVGFNFFDIWFQRIQYD